MPEYVEKEYLLNELEHTAFYLNADKEPVEDLIETAPSVDIDIDEVMILIEDVLDTLLESGNGVTTAMFHEAADKLFRVRAILEHFESGAEK